MSRIGNYLSGFKSRAVSWVRFHGTHGMQAKLARTSGDQGVLATLIEKDVVAGFSTDLAKNKLIIDLAAKANSTADPAEIEAAINSPFRQVVIAVAGNSHLTSGQAAQILKANYRDHQLAVTVLGLPRLKLVDILLYLHHEGYSSLPASKPLPKDISQAINSNPEVLLRVESIKATASPVTLTEAAKNPIPAVRKAALSSPHIPPRQLLVHCNDPEFEVRLAVAENPIDRPQDYLAGFLARIPSSTPRLHPSAGEDPSPSSEPSYLPNDKAVAISLRILEIHKTKSEMILFCLRQMNYPLYEAVLARLGRTPS